MNTATDMVITDMKMPGKNDGFDLLVAVRKITAETIVIIITAYGSVDGAVRCMINGAYDYMQKPVQMPELRIKIERAFEARADKRRFSKVKEFGNEMDQVLKEHDNFKKSLEKINKITKSILNKMDAGDIRNKYTIQYLYEILNKSSNEQPDSIKK